MKKNTIMKMVATVTTGILGLSMIGCGQETGNMNVAEETKKVVRTFFNEYQDYKTFGIVYPLKNIFHRAKVIL